LVRRSASGIPGFSISFNALHPSAALLGRVAAFRMSEAMAPPTHALVGLAGAI
jgi:hypothetical protein